MKVHCSQSCKCILDKLGGYNLEARGNVPMKGKGAMFTYWLIGEDESFRRARMQKAPKLFSRCQCTPSTPHKYFIAKNSPKTCLPSRETNSDENSNAAECNIMELLRETDAKFPRNESVKAFQPSPVPMGNAQTSGNAHVSIKSPANGIVTDTYARSSSGSDLTSQAKGVSEREPSERQGEGDSLLARGLSIGNKPKHRTNSHSGENKRVAISLKPLPVIDTQSSHC